MSPPSAQVPREIVDPAATAGQYMFYSEDYMFGDDGGGLPMPRPSLPGGIDTASDEGYYYLVLAIATLTAALVVLLTRSRLGRLLRGIADSPLAVETNGANANVSRVLVFCISAFLAAVGGALAGVAQTTASSDSYNPISSLLYFVVIVVVAGRGPWNAIIAAAAIILVPSYVSGDNVSTWLQLLLGIAAIMVAILPARFSGVPAPIAAWLDARLRGARRPASASLVRSTEGAQARTRVGAGALQLRRISVRFGGVLAVDDVDLDAPTGRITGLIGPNGAGKTTTFNAATGLLRATAGAVLLDGIDVTRTSASARARRGLGRTFQKMELLDSLSVRENVRLGAEAALSGLNPFTHVISKPGSRRSVAEHTEQAMRLCGIGDLADKPVHSLSTGQRRLVELARCLAGDFRIILMDEPSSGLDHHETATFGAILKTVIAERGIGILLVEHDMSLVLDVCESIYVLDFGRMIFHGTRDELTSSPLVQAAYLGDPKVEEAVASDAAELTTTPLADGAHA